jgi:hypothetical protein
MTKRGRAGNILRIWKDFPAFNFWRCCPRRGIILIGGGLNLPLWT